MKYLLTITLLAVLLASVSAKEYPKREMRAIWIATVYNSDWPSSKGLTTDQQKAEMIGLLDSAKAYNMNTIIFQVRPDADALYDSNLEPWSEWLSGKQGQAPDPWYDPLQFVIDECHKRGLDIHAWLNPCRAIQNINTTKAAPNHVSMIHPEWMVTYGTVRYIDPGIPAGRDHMARIVSDLVRRYDIDAIHLDDYFYPYKIAGQEYPDEGSFKKYPGNFGPKDKENWRRNNINLIIKQFHDSIKSIRPTVEFGIAPFGVWRNKKEDPEGSDTRATTNYDDLYADILKWQREKWIDYITPQLYWYIGKEVADYAILARWWASHSYGCNLYIGQAPYLINPDSKDQAWRSSDEIIKQINLNRSIPEIKGSMYFSARFMNRNPLGVKEKMLKEHYRFPALTPVNPLVEQVFPLKPVNPVLSKDGQNVVLSWEKQESNHLFVVYQYKKLQRTRTSKPDKIISVTSYQKLLLPAAKGYNPSRYKYAVTALSPTHAESDPVKFKK